MQDLLSLHYVCRTDGGPSVSWDEQVWPCGRSYPTPDFVWDRLDGQAYVYYPRSVPEGEFYREFGDLFAVEEPHEN